MKGRWIQIFIALLVGGLSFWALQPGSRWRLNEKDALCVLDLRAEKTQATATFTLTAPVEQFQVAARPFARGERLALSIANEKTTFFTGPVSASMRFGCGRGEAGKTYTVTLRQDSGTHGGEVIVAKTARATGLTGWQIWSRSFVALLCLAGIWAWMARRSHHRSRQVTSAWIFHALLLGATVLFVYLLFHEGGHALAAMLFGRFNLEGSDFWGLQGHPHSGMKMGPPLAPWQQALITFAGPAFPTLAGLVLYFVWAWPGVRRWRETHPIANLYASATVAMCILPFALLMPVALCVDIADESRAFVRLSTRLWLVETVLWILVLASFYILWRVVPVLIKTVRSLAANLRELSRTAMAKQIPS